MEYNEVNESYDEVCPYCGGILLLMGVLGRLYWYRCRSCGIECNESI